MKFLLASTMALVSAQETPRPAGETIVHGTSSLSELAHQYNELLGNSTERGLTGQDMGLLNNYGCWCYFEENHGYGRGQPVDELDTYCKQLHDGYECIISDSVDEGTPCIPWEQTYTSAFGFGFPSGLSQSDIDTNCDANNVADSCSARTCKVEGWFIQQYFSYTTQGGVIDAANRHANGFDVNVSCPITQGLQSEKACCGNYPARYPYKTYDGARDCCVSHTYNTNMFQCCNDGHIRVACN